MTARWRRDLFLVVLIFAAIGLFKYYGPAPRTVEQTVDAYLQAARTRDKPALDRVCAESYRSHALRTWMQEDFTWTVVSVKEETETTAQVLVDFKAGTQTFKMMVLLQRDKEWQVNNLMPLRT